jgi:hypothetical protein
MSVVAIAALSWSALMDSGRARVKFTIKNCKILKQRRRSSPGDCGVHLLDDRLLP